MEDHLSLESKVIIVIYHNEAMRSSWESLDPQRNTFYYVSCSETNLSEGLEWDPENGPDAIILEYCEEFTLQCENLKSNPQYCDVPIIVQFDELDSKLLVKGFAAGMDDYLVAPIEKVEMEAKLIHAISATSEKKRLHNELESSRQLAMHAIEMSGELGELMRIFEKIINCSNTEDVSQILLHTLEYYNLSGSIGIYCGDVESFYSTDGFFNEVESNVITAVRGRNSERMVDFGRRTIFNFEHISVLIKNMPEIGTENYGKVKDNLCLFLNIIDSKISALKAEARSSMQNANIIATVNVITQMIREIESSNVSVINQFENVILNLESSVQHDVTRFNLLQEEENQLLATINSAITNATDIFTESVNRETKHREILDQLVKTLENK